MNNERRSRRLARLGLDFGGFGGRRRQRYCYLSIQSFRTAKANQGSMRRHMAVRSLSCSWCRKVSTVRVPRSSTSCFTLSARKQRVWHRRYRYSESRRRSHA